MNAPVPESTDLLRDLVIRLQRATLSRLKRVPPEVLYRQPDPEANSIGVTIWHYTRWFDLFGTAVLVDRDAAEQHWFRDGWMERTGYDPRGIGYGGYGLITGYTVAEMMAVPRLGAADLGAYHQAAMDSVIGVLATEDRASLARTVRFVDTDSSRFELLLSLLLGATRHLGEIDALLPLFSRHPTDIV